MCCAAEGGARRRRPRPSSVARVSERAPAAEEAASKAQSSVGETRNASDAKVAAAEARGGGRACCHRVGGLAAGAAEDLALARQEVQRLEESANLTAATVAGLRLELAAEREQAANAAAQASSRLAAAEAIHSELQQRNLELSQAIGSGARMSEAKSAQALEAEQAQRQGGRAWPNA